MSLTWLWPQILKAFSILATCVMNISGKFNRNSPSQYRDITFTKFTPNSQRSWPLNCDLGKLFSISHSHATGGKFHWNPSKNRDIMSHNFVNRHKETKHLHRLLSKRQKATKIRIKYIVKEMCSTNSMQKMRPPFGPICNISSSITSSTLIRSRISETIQYLSLIHIWRCRRIERCRSRWSPYH